MKLARFTTCRERTRSACRRLDVRGPRADEVAWEGQEWAPKHRVVVPGVWGRGVADTPGLILNFFRALEIGVRSNETTARPVGSRPAVVIA